MCRPIRTATPRAGSWTRPRTSGSSCKRTSSTCCRRAAASGSGRQPIMGRRVLVTGLGTFWGGRLAQALEDDPSVEVIVGLDIEEPKVELERTEYVRAD